jgi:hypothetical protein
MTWLVWRQYRVQAAIAGGLLAAFAAVLIVTGVAMGSQWHAALVACTADHSCGSLSSTLSFGYSFAHDLTFLSLVVPGVLGLLIGAPLVAGEVETGTGSFVWTQSITRGRWLLAKAGWLLLAAAVWGGCVAALVTWWSGPPNALYADAFHANEFDMQGIVPIGYAVFGVALGIAAGALLRRTLPAIAVTLAGFIGVRVLVAQVFRAHYQTAVTTYYSLTSNWQPASGSWVLGSGLVNKAGHAIAMNPNAKVAEGIPVSALSAACQKLLPTLRNGPSLVQNGMITRGLDDGRVAACIQAAGFRQFSTYQPVSRYWAFQSIETVIFLALAAGLIAIAFAVVRRHDA